jgi:hypothetical protein
MFWSYYELFVDDSVSSTNSQLTAIIKKALGLIFAICALATFRGCYDGMGNSDEAIEVTSYEYGAGFICLIMNVLLTVTAGIISLVVMKMKSNAEVQVEAADLKVHKTEHTAKQTEQRPKAADGEGGDFAFQSYFHESLELNCEHAKHSHGFDEKPHIHLVKNEYSAAH